MDSTAISAFILVNFLLFSSASAFNVTTLLGDHPDFSSFNNFLTQTKLADEINSRETITVLAVDNGAISSLSGKPLDLLKRILSVHVVLDYYDVQKLGNMSSDNTTVLTTMFQSTGAAGSQQGFLKVKVVKGGEVSFGSAVSGAPIDSKLVKSVVSRPYNISVLQISSSIQVPGIESIKAPPPSKSTAPAGSPKKAPAPSAETPSNADAPTAETPKADADSPVSSPPKPDADAPTAADVDGDSDAAAPGPSGKSGASRSSFVGAAAVIAVISSFLAI